MSKGEITARNHGWSPELLTVLGATLAIGVGLAGLILNVQAQVHEDMRAMEIRIHTMETRIREDVRELREDVRELRGDVGELRERVSHLRDASTGEACPYLNPRRCPHQPERKRVASRGRGT